MKRKTRRTTIGRLFFENGLSIVVLSSFFIFWALQIVTGWFAYNSDRRDHGQPPVALIGYFSTGHFIEATAENWESEFLQMGAFIWLTSFLYQKGSPESKDPYDHDDEVPAKADSPAPARSPRPWVRAMYGRSLSIAFLLMFLISFVLHAIGGAYKFSDEQVQVGQSPVTVLQYMVTSQFWFESFQNWQSEFLAIGAMVVLSIFLRERGSAESKPVAAPHHVNE